MSVAGFRPGLGLGGTTHSFVVMETFCMTGGGGVGSGLMTEAMDILLMGPPGDGADGETLGDGLIETGGGPL